jgi:hypothetical protein
MFPSELPFFSFLCLFKQGEGAELSKLVRDVLKGDSHASIKLPSGVITVHGIGGVVRRLKDRFEEFPFLRECLGKDVHLIPMPRSTPLVDKSALWPSLRICQELQKCGLSGPILPIVERVKAIQKAAFAEPGKRPNPSDHRDSTRIQGTLERPRRITLVDDFVTRGSSFVGIYPRVREMFPEAEIHCFGLMRTASGAGEHRVIEPVKGKITFGYARGGWPSLVREP